MTGSEDPVNRFTFSTFTTSDHPDARRFNNNLVYIAAVLSDILERLQLIPPDGTGDEFIVEQNATCCVDDCDGQTYSVLVEPDEEPTPICITHFNELMQSHLDKSEQGSLYVKENINEDW